MASAVPELTCGDYQSDMDSPKHGQGSEDDQEVQNPHHRGNGIYMDDCWGIIVKLDSWNSIPLFACLLTLPSPSQCIRLK